MVHGIFFDIYETILGRNAKAISVDYTDYIEIHLEWSDEEFTEWMGVGPMYSQAVHILLR